MIKIFDTIQLISSYDQVLQNTEAARCYRIQIAFLPKFETN